MVWVIALSLFTVFALYFIIPFVMKIILRKKFLAAINKSESVCLTFDDGPNPVTTKKIINLLEDAGAKATFFVVGEKVKKYPELVEQLVNAGHEIGEHSYQHSHPWKCGPIKSIRDLIQGYHTIQHYICSGKPVLFRPPYGKLNLITLIYILLFSRKLVFWDIDPRDYAQESANEVVHYVTQHLVAGSVILLHDGRRNFHVTTEITAKAVKSILEECENRGLALITVSKALIKTSREK